MPLDTDDSAWSTPETHVSGDHTDHLAVEAKLFLNDNSGQAFTVLELADELLDTAWAEVLHSEDPPDRRIYGYLLVTAQLQTSLQMLVARSEADVRLVPVEDAADPHLATDGSVPHFSSCDQSDIVL